MPRSPYLNLSSTGWTSNLHIYEYRFVAERDMKPSDMIITDPQAIADQAKGLQDATDALRKSFQTVSSSAMKDHYHSLWRKMEPRTKTPCRPILVMRDTY